MRVRRPSFKALAATALTVAAAGALFVAGAIGNARAGAPAPEPPLGHHEAKSTPGKSRPSSWRPTSCRANRASDRVSRSYAVGLRVRGGRMQRQKRRSAA